MPNKELSVEHQAFIDALLTTRGNVTKAAELTGFSVQYGYRLMKLLREHIIATAEEVLALHAIRATNVLIDGMEGDLEIGANNQIESAKQVLDRIGLVKKDKVEISGPAGGIFLFPEKRND